MTMQRSAADTFSGLGIDVSAPGFYDDPLFQSQERRNPQFLEKYAQFVRDLELDDAYLERARALIPNVAERLLGEYQAINRQRACMDAGLALSKMLEELGIWNAVVRGAVSVEAEGIARSKRYLHAFGPLDPGSSVHGHVWLLAPPYYVVDMSMTLQPWGVSALNERMPNVVLIESADGIAPTPELLIDHDVLSVVGAMWRRFVPTQAQALMNEFPGASASINGVSFVYQPTAITAPDTPFELIGTGPGGLPAKKVWVERILPNLDSGLIGRSE